MATNNDLPRLPFQRRHVLDVPPRYRELRAERPITRVRTMTGDEAWLVTGYQEVRRLLADERLGRSHPDPLRAPRLSNSVMMGGPMVDYETEKASHERMRRMLVPSFSARRMKALSEHVQTLVDTLLDGLAAQTSPVDLHEELSLPLPVLVICELLGVPYADRERFRVWSDEMAGLTDPVRAGAARNAMTAYMYELIAAKRREPAEDVISDMAAVAAEDDTVDDDEIARLAGGLLFAGHETTVVRIDYGTVSLLTNLHQRDALSRNPALAPGAVEEILRMAPLGETGLLRYARTDVDVDGLTIRAGELVIIEAAAANRDETVFPDPDRFDITREPGEPHVGFGYAHHFCIGASLARVELQAVFGTLFQRFPTLRLAVPFDELRLQPDRLTGGFVEVPVAW